MWMIPFDRSQRLSPITKEQFAERLRQNVRVGQNWGGVLRTPTGHMFGKLDGDQFALVRRCGYQNSYLPIVRGTLRSTGSGLVVQLIFIAPFFFPTVGLILVGEGILLWNGLREIAVIWAGMGVMLHVLGWLAYRREARIIERKLGEIVADPPILTTPQP
jgi:hypothetical protein